MGFKQVDKNVDDWIRMVDNHQQQIVTNDSLPYVPSNHATEQLIEHIQRVLKPYFVRQPNLVGERVELYQYKVIDQYSETNIRLILSFVSLETDYDWESVTDWTMFEGGQGRIIAVERFLIV